MKSSSFNFSQPENPTTRVGGYNTCIVDQACQNSSGKFKGFLAMERFPSSNVLIVDLQRCRDDIMRKPPLFCGRLRAHR